MIGRTTFLLLLLASTGANPEVLERPPEIADSGAHYLFYLHGGIVEGSDGRPVSEQYGPYEYRAIVDRFDEAGFVVISEIRSGSDSVGEYADRVVGWIQQLREAGVPAGHIAVVGASMGGMIAVHVSSRLADPQLRFTFVAGLFSRQADDAGVQLAGHILSIHDADDVSDIEPARFIDGNPRVTSSEVIVTDTGLGHGLLYTPHPLWIDPAIRWSGGD